MSIFKDDFNSKKTPVGPDLDRFKFIYFDPDEAKLLNKMLGDQTIVGMVNVIDFIFQTTKDHVEEINQQRDDQKKLKFGFEVFVPDSKNDRYVWAVKSEDRNIDHVLLSIAGHKTWSGKYGARLYSDQSTSFAREVKDRHKNKGYIKKNWLTVDGVFGYIDDVLSKALTAEHKKALELYKQSHIDPHDPFVPENMPESP